MNLALLPRALRSYMYSAVLKAASFSAAAVVKDMTFRFELREVIFEDGSRASY